MAEHGNLAADYIGVIRRCGGSFDQDAVTGNQARVGGVYDEDACVTLLNE
jgi:hypothetical protein